MLIADVCFENFSINEYEHLICNLINRGGMSYDQYIEIRTDYISQNPNLWIFEISAPRGFGEKFAQTFVQGKCSKLKKASKKIDVKGQHRGNKGNEGQLHVKHDNIHLLDQYELKDDNIERAIRNAAAKK